MQAVSNEFKQMCKSNTPSGAIGRIRVIEDDITIAENTDIKDIKIEDNCYVNDKFIGTTVAKKVTVNLFNDNNEYDLENKEIEVKLGFQHYEKEQTYEGKNIEITDAKPLKPQISLYGESNQEMRSGNLIPMSVFDEMNLSGANSNEEPANTYDGSTHTITVNFDIYDNFNGRYKYFNIGYEENKKYTCSFYIRGTAGKKVRCGPSSDEIPITLTDEYVRYSVTYDPEYSDESINFYTEEVAEGGLDVGEYMQFANVQIEEGEVATEYIEYGENPISEIKNVTGDVNVKITNGLHEEYKEQSVIFPLGEEKLYEGSYLAEDGIHHIRKQIVLDGSDAEEWILWASTSLVNVTRFSLNHNLENLNATEPIMCSHFTYDGRDGDFEHIRYGGNNYSQFIVYINNTIASTLEDFKAWLSANPITVEYKLAEPEVIPYTEEQQEAWDKIKELNLYEGTNYISSNANLIVTLGEELTSFGNFIIEKPDTEEVQAITRFVGYDYMIKFNKVFFDNNTYPISLGEYFSNLCNQVGVETGNIDFINSDYMVQGNPFTNNEDCKTVLSAIAQIAGGIAKIGRDNKAYIVNLSNGDALEEIDGNNYDTFTPNKVFGPINKVIFRMNSGVDGEESVRTDDESVIQNGECAITISDNPILNSAEQRELVIDNIFNVLNGITYLPYKTTYYGYPHADSIDKIKIFNVNDTEYNSYIFNHTLKYDGAFSGTIETPALTKTQSMYKNTLDFKTRFKNTELAVDKINGEIKSIIEVQEDTKGKVNVITQDIDATTAKIEKIENETTSQINELKETVNGVTNTLTQKGGNNIFYYDIEYWVNDIEEINLKEETTEIKNNSVSGMGYLVHKGSAYQTIQDIQNGTYTISFKYKKIGPELANASVRINDEEYPLTATGWTEFVHTIQVNANYIKVEFISDTDNTLYVTDLLGNIGTEKDVWTQNPNETRTDTVTIGKGIKVESTEEETFTKIDADGTRIYNKNNLEKPITKFTKNGTETKELIVEGQAQIAGVLIKQVRRPVMVFKLIIKLKNEQ